MVLDNVLAASRSTSAALQLAAQSRCVAAVAAAVALQEGKEESTIRREMLQHISIVIACSTAHRVFRRIWLPKRVPAWAAAVNMGVNLEDPDGFDGIIPIEFEGGPSSMILASTFQ